MPQLPQLLTSMSVLVQPPQSVSGGVHITPLVADTPVVPVVGLEVALSLTPLVVTPVVATVAVPGPLVLLATVELASVELSVPLLRIDQRCIRRQVFAQLLERHRLQRRQRQCVGHGPGR